MRIEDSRFTKNRVLVSIFLIKGPVEPTSVSFSEDVDYTVLLRALQRSLSSENARFSSQLQSRALCLIFKRLDVIVNLGTGEGKSALIYALPFLESNIVTVVVPLFKSLVLDLAERLQKLNIPHQVWRPGYPDSSFSVSRLLIVSVENFVDGAASTIKYLKNTGKLARVIIDEAHELVTSSNYREAIQQIPLMTQTLAVPIVLLSATLPVGIMESIQTLFNGTKFSVVKGNLKRKNIRYTATIEQYSARTAENPVFILVKTVLASLRQINLGLYERGIIYVKSRELVSHFCRLADYFRLSNRVYGYYSGYERNQENYCAWKSEASWMVATSGFGCGIDYPSVRYVFSVEGGYSILEMIQQSGRAGRDGVHSIYNIVAFDGTQQNHLLGLGKDEAEVKDLIGHCQRRCIRQMLFSSLGEGYSCVELSAEYVMCGFCSSTVTKSVPRTVHPAIQEIQREITSASAQRAIGLITVRYNQIKDVISRIKDVCLICSPNPGLGEQPISHFGACPKRISRCLRCFEVGHSVRNCRVRKKPYPNGYCAICLFPVKEFHSDGNMVGNGCHMGRLSEELIAFGFNLYEENDQYRFFAGIGNRQELLDYLRTVCNIWRVPNFVKIYMMYLDKC